MGVRDTIAKAIMGIKAYHGSPHSFDRFDASKIGTGEGAQAYGHGLYFAGNENVARGYRDALSPTGDLLVGGKPFPVEHAGALGEQNDFLKRLYSRVQVDKRDYGSVFPPHYTNEEIDNALSNLKASPELRKFADQFRGQQLDIKPGGHMYEVNIKADPAQMLDWDKPLSAQGLDLNRAADLAFPAARGLRQFQSSIGKVKGEDFYRDVARHSGDPAVASQALQEAGIPGIKYLDEGSRSHAASRRVIEEAAQLLPNDAAVAKRLQELNALPAPTSNYVVFDPANIDILKKYGVAAAPTAALGATYDQSQYGAQ